MGIPETKYQELAQLHRENTTVLVRVKRLTTHEQVLVKTFHADFPSPKEVLRLKREYEIAKRASAPGVLAPLALESNQNSWMLLLEDCGGGTLEQHVKRYGQLPIYSFLEIALQVTETVLHLHRKNIIHHDIRPANILYNERTGVVKLTNFASASLLSGERPEMLQQQYLGDALPYVSPEQTGRLDRPTDFRSDLYSLGVAFYEMLTGTVPFAAEDTVHFIYQLLTAEPTPPAVVAPQIPEPISALIMKCLAKNAEDRYQSAYGIKHDLEQCLLGLSEEDHIEPFSIGRADRTEHFRIPDVLYGRDEELRQLTGAFERVRHGTGETVFVCGASGVGKTALVQEVKSIVLQERGYFVMGKFDPRNQVPYQGVVQALQQLILQLLAESDASVAARKEAILKAVGPGVPALTEVMPALELIVGPQPPAVQFRALGSQNKFRMAMQNLLGALTSAENPLVIFLDDLQWADSASLQLIQFLVGENSASHLLFIGGCREAEASWIQELRQREEGYVRMLALAPFGSDQVRQMVMDTMRCAQDQAAPLAQTVMEKGGGNPFYTKQFLQSMHVNGLLQLDGSSGEWRWDLEQVQRMQVSASQVDFMLDKRRKLPEGVQQALQTASCIGDSFDLEALHAVLERDLPSLAADLLLALEEGILLSRGSAYKWLYDIREGNIAADSLDQFRIAFQFVHDRVRRASYESLDEAERKRVHLRIGRWLSRLNISGDREDLLFERVAHLNEAVDLIERPAEREELARWNLNAAKRAQTSTAYEQGLRYVRLGISLLNANSWEEQHELAFDLHRVRYELEYLCGHGRDAESLFKLLVQQARTLEQRRLVYCLKIVMFTFEDRMADAVQVGREGLRAIGYRENLRMNRLSRQWAFWKLKRQLAKVREYGLSEQSMTDDPQATAQMAVLALLGHPAYYTDQNLYQVLILRVLELSLSKGFTEYTSGAMVAAGVMLMNEFGDTITADRLARLGVEWEDRVSALKGELPFKNLNLYASTIQPWTTHYKAVLQSLQTVVQRTVASGDLLRAANALADMAEYHVRLGTPLEDLKLLLQEHATTFERGKSEWVMMYVHIVTGLIRNAQGAAQGVADLSGDDFDETQYREKVLPHLPPAQQAWYYVCKIWALLLADESEALQRLIASLSGILTSTEDAELVFVSAVIASDDPSVDRARWKNSRKRMRQWARICPENYLHRLQLLDAETARMEGREREAMDLYDKAIETASKNGFLHHVALANERAALFYQRIGKHHLAEPYLAAAHYGYIRWGARAKANRLEDRYPAVYKTAQEVAATSASIDLLSVMKAARTISGEIVFERLLEKLIEIVVENAGAQKVLLLMQDEGNWQVVARKLPDSSKVWVLESTPWQKCSELSPMIVQYVSRLQEAVVVQDAVRDELFAKDPYIREQQPKSILCQPMLRQGQMIGMIYLENNVVTHGFTADRLEVMDLLSAQFAVSIENAELYRQQVRLNQAYGRFVPRQFLHLLQKKSIVDVELGDHTQMDMTVVFADIRSFTTLSEEMTPEENFYFLNEFLGRMEPVIKQYGGFIDKYIGDSIMALFDREPDDALSAAVAMLGQLQLFNEHRVRTGGEAIRIGIGINSGSLMLGTIGGHERMDSTVISDAVNLASRIENLTKTYGVPLLISEHARSRLSDPDRYAMRLIDQVVVRGRSETVELYEVFEADPEAVREGKLRSKMLFEEAYAAYWDGDLVQAKVLFEECLQEVPGDAVAELYLERCKIRNGGIDEEETAELAVSRKLY